MPFAKIDNAAASGDIVVVAAQPGRRIVVTSYTLIVAGAVTVTWKSGSTAVSGPMTFGGAGQGAAPPPLPVSGPGGLRGLIEADASQALTLNVSGAVQVGGHLTYELR